MLRSSRILLVTVLFVTGGVRSLKANSFTDQLRAQDANPDFIAWAETNQIQSPSDAWDKLQRPEWMLQLAYLWSAKSEDPAVVTIPRLNESRLRLFAADCAERVFPIFQRAYPNDRRPWVAIKVARLYANGKATKEELKAANVDAATAASAAGQAVIDADADPNTIDYEGFEALCASTSIVACTFIVDDPTATFHAPTTDPSVFYAEDPTAKYIAAASAAATYADQIYSEYEVTSYERQRADSERAWQADRLRFYFQNPFEPYIPPPPEIVPLVVEK